MTRLHFLLSLVVRLAVDQCVWFLRGCHLNISKLE